jgi:two-component system response regulator RegA
VSQQSKLSALRGSVRSVLIVDDHEPFLTSLGASFHGLGIEVWMGGSIAECANLVPVARPDIIVSELTVGGESFLAAVPELRALHPGVCIVVTTLCPSIRAATAATRRGVDAYLVKPVTPALILSTLQFEEAPEPGLCPPGRWPSLDRTIWEYLNQVFVVSGSMSEAARRLRLDRRSLRRMLARDAPAA